MDRSRVRSHTQEPECRARDRMQSQSKWQASKERVRYMGRGRTRGQD